MLPRFSVIIPVYNAEKTIIRCIDSLLRQNCADVEIILVNDGSQDNSGMICEEYARNNGNVRYIVQQNAGVSAARNAGLDMARGEYILFVDSDDYVSVEFLSTLREKLASRPTDFMQFSHASVKDGQITEQRLIPRELTGDEMERAIQQAICDKTINSPGAKVFRRELIEANSIRFPLGISIGEDRLFNMEYALQIRSYSVSDFIAYYLCLDNEQSLSRRKNDLQTQDRLYCAAFDAMIARSSGSQIRKEMICRADHFGICRSVYTKAKYMHREGIHFLDRIRTIRALCRKINGQKLKMPDTRYCRMVSLPVRWNLALVIDIMAATLLRRQNS